MQYKKYNNDTNVIKDRVVALANAVDAVSNFRNTNNYSFDIYFVI